MRDISISYIDGVTLFAADAVLQQYEIALFTNEQGFPSDPTFGIGISSFVGEQNSPSTAAAIKSIVESITSRDFPEIRLLSINVTAPAFNQITVDIRVMVIPYGEERTISKTLG